MVISCSTDNYSMSIMDWLLSFPIMATISPSVLNEANLGVTLQCSVWSRSFLPKPGTIYKLFLSLCDWYRHHYLLVFFFYFVLSIWATTICCNVAYMLWNNSRGQKNGICDYLLGLHLPRATCFYWLFIRMVANKKKIFLKHFVIVLVHLGCYNKILLTR